ncbi:MAG: DegV family protein [Actinobacteria bacterium]|nr:DegV family protein [Actinomycetota bacterium]
MAVRVVADSTSYIPRPLREALGIGIVSLSSTLGGVTYPDDAEDYSEFYDALAASSELPTTSQPSVQAMVDLLQAPVAEGHEVVGVFISELMSGTYANALLARDMVRETYPDAVIEIVDGRSNSMELGFAVLAAARKAADGGSVAEVVQAAEEMTRHTRFLFTPLTLEYLRRGGRIGNAKALLATLLQIKPVLTVVDGVTDTFAKVRTLQKSHDLIVDTFAADVRDKGGLGEVYVHHIHDAKAGRALADRVAEIAGRAVEIIDVGPGVGSHVGPGTVAVVYYTNGPMRKSW